MILCLETATNICSVALCDNEQVIALKETGDSRSHASMLTVLINDILEEAGTKPAELDAIAVSKGPGSYTGLRIGVSVAKGIAYGSTIPLIGIETTLSMFWGATGGKQGTMTDDCATIYCPVLDARRMEVYYAIYDCNGSVLKEISAEIINEESFYDMLLPRKMVFFGDGATKLKEVIKRPNIYFKDDFRMSAAHMCNPSSIAFNSKKFEDIAYFEPLYLKDFLTTVRKKNILGTLLA